MSVRRIEKFTITIVLSQLVYLSMGLHFLCLFHSWTMKNSHFGDFHNQALSSQGILTVFIFNFIHVCDYYLMLSISDQKNTHRSHSRQVWRSHMKRMFREDLVHQVRIDLSFC